MMRHAGVGALIPPDYPPGSAQYAAYCDGLSTLDSFNPMNIGYCLINDIGTKAISQTGSAPSGVLAGAPTMNSCSAGSPGATLAGPDANGNPVYVCESTPTDEQAATVAALQAAAAAQDAANALNPLSPGGSVDCTQWYNALNSACLAPGASTWLWVGGGVIAAMLLVEFLRGRR